MDKQTYKVLVPYDFSSVADCAVHHAAKIAKSFSGEVYLLHVVSKEKEVDDVKLKLTKTAEDAEKKLSVNFHIIVRIGNIFDDIGDVASEITAGVIVMGTHGAKGMQKIMGSHAIKVISNSKVPFIIVQDKYPSESNTYDDIAIPIDYSAITKQKLTIAAKVAQHFNSKIHIFSDVVSDDYLQSKLQAEISFAKNYFRERNITFDVSYAQEKGNFKKQLIRYAATVDADMIAIVNTQEGNIIPDFFGSEEQEIIANDAEIPVLITNPTQKFVGGGVIGS